MKNKKTLNCKDVKFTKELSIYKPDCLNNTFKYTLRRCSTSKKFFELLDKQLPNQLLYNTEEKEAYFLNSDRELFKLKFEPIDEKKKTDTLKEVEVRKLAIPWNKFHNKNYNSYICSNFSLIEITNLFISLLDLVKKKQIKVRCGIAMMHLLTFSPIYYSTKFGEKLKLGTCEIDLELDFSLAKYDLMYDGILLVGESIVEEEQKEVKIEEELKPKKKLLGLF
jgi:hypothetical protein